MGKDAWQDILERVWALEHGGGGGGGPLVVSDPTYCTASVTITPTGLSTFVQPPYVIALGDLVTVDEDGGVFAAADGVYAIFFDVSLGGNGDSTNETLVPIMVSTDLLSCAALVPPLAMEGAPLTFKSSTTVFGKYLEGQQMATAPGITMGYDDPDVIGTFDVTAYLIVVELSTS